LAGDHGAACLAPSGAEKFDQRLVLPQTAGPQQQAGWKLLIRSLEESRQ
jgi:hypothetical protein